MSYTITKTTGATLATIADGTVDTNTVSLALIGKNYAGYGVFLNENFVKLLENFASGNQPSKPMVGQLWYTDSGVGIGTVSYYTGKDYGWKNLASISSSDTEPPSGVRVAGDFWWDTTNAQLYVFDGSAYVLIGPMYQASAGTSGAIVDTITDTALNSRIVVRFVISNTTIAILTREAFTPLVAIPGFTSFNPGINLISSSTLLNAQFSGDAENALKLQGLTASQFIRRDQNSDTPFRLQVDALAVGSSAEITKSGTTEVAVKSLTPTAALNMYVNGGATNALSIRANAAVYMSSTLSTAGSLTVDQSATIKQNLSVTGTTALQNTTTVSAKILPSVTNTHDIGSTTQKFATIHATTFSGTAVQAQYADLAERFAADKTYPAGTVVALGGAAEITAECKDLSEDVFGVISTCAGFLMNGAAGDDNSHPPIAMTGRVPVRVKGKVRKGDRLVSAGAGMARAAKRSEINSFNVIGRALENKDSDNEGLVEVIVKLNS